MNALNDVLKAAFTEYTIDEKECVIFGEGKIDALSFHIIGVKENTFLGVQQSLVIAEKLIDILESKSQKPVFLLVDVAGQELSMQDEWLGMHQYFGHILACLSCLRKQKNRLISLIYNQAIGGGFIAYGLMADSILALPDAKVAVMWLEGMSKVTKIPLEKLQELSKTSPVFAPGIDNFKQLGGIHDIVDLPNLQKKLLEEAVKTDTHDTRAQLGFERGGRKLAYKIINKIVE
jgi:malonate decarboxylase gamma subunit